MILIFFDAKGVIYTNYVPEQNCQHHISEVGPGRFLKVFEEKRSFMSSQDWFLHWDNVLVHTATSVQLYLVTKGSR